MCLLPINLSYTYFFNILSVKNFIILNKLRPHFIFQASSFLQFLLQFQFSSSRRPPRRIAPLCDVKIEQSHLEFQHVKKILPNIFDKRQNNVINTYYYCAKLDSQLKQSLQRACGIICCFFLAYLSSCG